MSLKNETENYLEKIELPFKISDEMVVILRTDLDNFGK